MIITADAYVIAVATLAAPTLAEKARGERVPYSAHVDIQQAMQTLSVIPNLMVRDADGQVTNA